jgi:hypothetical protein
VTASREQQRDAAIARPQLWQETSREEAAEEEEDDEEKDGKDAEGEGWLRAER